MPDILEDKPHAEQASLLEPYIAAFTLDGSVLATDSYTGDSTGFEVDLETSRVYRRTEQFKSDISFTSSAMRSHTWSIFSGLSLSEVSVISAIALPLYLNEIYNNEWYTPNEFDYDVSRQCSRSRSPCPRLPLSVQPFVEDELESLPKEFSASPIPSYDPREQGIIDQIPTIVEASISAAELARLHTQIHPAEKSRNPGKPRSVSKPELKKARQQSSPPWPPSFVGCLPEAQSQGATLAQGKEMSATPVMQASLQVCGLGARTASPPNTRIYTDRSQGASAAGKMALYRLVMLGDGGVGKTELSTAVGFVALSLDITADTLSS